MEAKILEARGKKADATSFEDDDDEDRIRMRAPPLLKRSKSKKLKAQGNKRRLDARQYAVLCGVVFLISWGIVVTFLLLNLGIKYNFSTVPTTREDYSVQGAAELAKKQASEDLMQGIDVWNVINASITGLVFRAPTDLTNLGNVLSPVFDTMSALHSVEFAFSDRAAQVSLTRREGTIVRGPSSQMQASSADCFLMGVEGCVAQPLTMPLEFAPRPYWYDFGMRSLRPTPHGGVFAWWHEPELVVEATPDGADILWPAVRLVFKLAFPLSIDSSGANTVVVGRITIKLSSLGGSRLADERLGSDGKIYLCDAGGMVLASQNVFDVLGVRDGQVRFRYAWEAGGAWASSISSAFAGSSIREMKTEADDTFVAVEPLPYPLAHFAIVVVAPSREPFANSALVGTSALASVVAPAPYAITCWLAGMFIIGQCISTLRSRETGPEALAPASQGRASIKDTMSTSVSYNIYGREQKQKRSLKDRARRMSITMHSLFGGGSHI